MQTPTHQAEAEAEVEVEEAAEANRRQNHVICGEREGGAVSLKFPKIELFFFSTFTSQFLFYLLSIFYFLFFFYYRLLC